MMQLLILVSAMVAIALVTQPHARTRAAGCLVGLAGQPFWILETWHGGQWGMLLVSLWFAAVYALGAWRGRAALAQWWGWR